MSQMMDPTQMGPPPDPGMGAPAAGPPGMMDPGMAGPPPDGMPPGGPPPDLSGGGGLPPELMAALGGGGGGNSTDLLAQGPLAGEDTALADEPDGSDPLALVRKAVELLRQAGMDDSDDVRSHLIDKMQADGQKILAGESQKTDKLRAALGG